eukprot:TRINITY_DN95880_c0_g1_i1.p1 TRINITY_DN95880_c0_g1~~TRINITY_DN95880_c0_g1_i1.p1  ORF type:complete len:164 (-),score=19.57 TRINITY_DN95880_c0_g1_i1:114-605(-)
MSVGATVAVINAKNGNRTSRRPSIDKVDLNLSEVPIVYAYSQKDPLTSHELMLPRAYRKGSTTQVTREMIQQWLGEKLKMNVTDVGIMVPGTGLEYLSMHDVADFFSQGSPFEQGSKIIVCSDGEDPDPDVIDRISKPTAGRISVALAESSQKSTRSSFCVIS